MGTWGTGSFENDDAMDWLAELEAEGLPAAGFAIQAVLEGAPDFLEAPVCANAIAAAEVLAALQGKPAAGLPDELTAWIQRSAPTRPSDLVANARRALDLILSQSELLDLWAESPENNAWLAGMRDLQNRLAFGSSGGAA